MIGVDLSLNWKSCGIMWQIRYRYGGLIQIRRCQCVLQPECTLLLAVMADIE